MADHPIENHPVVEVLGRMHRQMREQADALEAAIHGNRHDGARRFLTFYSATLAPTLRTEDTAFLAVLREHVGAADLLVDHERWRSGLRVAAARLRERLEDGRGLRSPLARTARNLRKLADFEERELLPWAGRELGRLLLREADRRVKEAESAVSRRGGDQPTS